MPLGIPSPRRFGRRAWFSTLAVVVLAGGVIATGSQSFAAPKPSANKPSSVSVDSPVIERKADAPDLQVKARCGGAAAYAESPLFSRFKLDNVPGDEARTLRSGKAKLNVSALAINGPGADRYKLSHVNIFCEGERPGPEVRMEVVILPKGMSMTPQLKLTVTGKQIDIEARCPYLGTNKPGRALVKSPAFSLGEDSLQGKAFRQSGFNFEGRTTSGNVVPNRGYPAELYCLDIVTGVYVKKASTIFVPLSGMKLSDFKKLSGKRMSGYGYSHNKNVGGDKRSDGGGATGLGTATNPVTVAVNVKAHPGLKKDSIIYVPELKLFGKVQDVPALGKDKEFSFWVGGAKDSEKTPKQETDCVGKISLKGKATNVYVIPSSDVKLLNPASFPVNKGWCGAPK